ncbi:hypothetical protein HYR99_16380 [Candidatus Poribacteria bacterium]|nr:hypothetical protein [Candidatus Poribacteria bacterium]
MSEIRVLDFNSDILKKVEKELGPLNKQAREAVLRGLELAFQKGEPPKPVLAWQGENPPYVEAECLSLSERSRRMRDLETQNQVWLERKCEELGASWLIVVDGEVLAHGATLADYVSGDALRKWCEQTEKLPLVYEHPRSLAIEESAPWHLTAYPQDAYPTLELGLVGNGNRAELVADFDTGSLETYADLDSLQAQGVVQIAPQDVLRQHVHLGQAFAYFIKHVTLLLTSEDGVTQQLPRGVRCVLNWQQSPFVHVNPYRQALAGRGIGLQFQPLLTLDFSRRETRLHW